MLERRTRSPEASPNPKAQPSATNAFLCFPMLSRPPETQSLGYHPLQTSSILLIQPQILPSAEKTNRRDCLLQPTSHSAPPLAKSRYWQDLSVKSFCARGSLVVPFTA